MHLSQPNNGVLYGLPHYRNRGVILGVCFSFAMMIMGLVVATQYVASHMGYAPHLGIPLIGNLYSPHLFFLWVFKFVQVEHYQPMVWKAVGIFVSCVVSGIAFSSYLIWRGRHDLPQSDVHGSARFADSADIEKAGITADRGVYLGLFKDNKTTRYLQHDGEEHILVYAPTGSGKGVGIVIPTLLSWQHSAVIFDIKGENWDLTAGFRAKELKQKVLKFEPLSADNSSCNWNPLWEIRTGKLEISDTEEIANLIVNPNGDSELDHWRLSAATLIKGAILHILYTGKQKTLREVALLLAAANQSFDITLQSMLSCKHDPKGQYGWTDGEGNKAQTHPVVQVIARAMLDKSEKERSGVQSSALSYLEVFRDDPLVVQRTSTSDFLIEDLTRRDDPVSLYIVVSPGDLGRMKGLIRILLNFIDKKLTKKLDFNKHRLLMMMDEFPSLGRLDFFQDSLAYSRGYGIKCVLITQDIKQLHRIYSRDEVVQSNAHTRVALRPNTLETAKMLSDMTGVRTVMKHSRSFTGKRSKWMMSNMSESLTEAQRPLLTPDEVSRLPEDKALVFVAGHCAVLCERIKYYEDGAFIARSRIAAPAVSDTFGYSIDSLELPNIITESLEENNQGLNHYNTHNNIVELPPMAVPEVAVKPDSITHTHNPFVA